jgi:hypothetical protein
MVWSEQEIQFLKDNYDKPYPKLSELLGRSVRAIKHKVGQLGLKRSERKHWSEDELAILRANPGLTPKEFVERGLIDRSIYQVAHRLRAVRGTANRVLVFPESNDVAWLLGFVYADGYVSNAALSFSQNINDKVIIDEVRRIVETVVGGVMTVKVDKKYVRAWSSSKMYSKLIHKESWDSISFLRMLENDYSWVLSEDYVWSFLGGVFDGDGSYIVYKQKGGSVNYPKVSLAVSQPEAADWFMSLFNRLGFDSGFDGKQIEVRGGRDAIIRFVRQLQCVLPRKQVRCSYPEGISLIRESDAELFLSEFHYLKTLPVGCQCYGFVENGALLGVACFGPSQVISQSKKYLELRRFALSDNRKNLASQFLGKLLKLLKAEGSYDVVVTYADSERGHDGTIYKAANFEYVGDTAQAYALKTASGKLVSGRFAIESLGASGCKSVEVVKVKPKKKYVYNLN